MLSLRPRVKGSGIYAVGTVAAFMANSLPVGWLELEVDKWLSPTQYPALFAVIGYSMGRSGDNFLVPGYKSGSFDSRFIKLIEPGIENQGVFETTNAIPLHSHSAYSDSDGNHSHSFPSGPYLRNDSVLSGAPNANGGGSTYSSHSSVSHSTHSHSDGSSGTVTGLAVSNIAPSGGGISRPPQIGARIGIYTGV